MDLLLVLFVGVFLDLDLIRRHAFNAEALLQEKVVLLGDRSPVLDEIKALVPGLLLLFEEKRLDFFVEFGTQEERVFEGLYALNEALGEAIQNSILFN